MVQIWKRNSVGPQVVAIKKKLIGQGYWSDQMPLGPTFGPKLEDAVAYFQQTHLGPNGQPLIVDGIVGPNTMWALRHPTGEGQKEGLGPVLKETKYEDIPAGIGGGRELVLAIALNQYGIRERPMGSNRGDSPRGGVDKFLPAWCKKKPGKGPAWCCFFVSWVTHKAFGHYPLGRVHGSCAKAWAAAKKQDLTYERHDCTICPDCQTLYGITLSKPARCSICGYKPLGMLRDKRLTEGVVPGNAFLMKWGPRTGHIGFIYRVSKNGTAINTIEGNCANRVKIGRRSLIGNSIYGIIDFWRNEDLAYSENVDLGEFERGLIQAPNVGRARTR